MLERLKGYVQNPVFLFILWMGVGLACSLSLMMKGVYSNYVIFSQSFWHAISSSPLYVEYLQEQKDFFLYGISFTALISPFAVLPRPLGMILWCLVNCGFLYYAISKLDLKKWQFAVVILVSVNDVFTAVLSQQYSIGITAMIIFSYVLIEKEKDFWSALMIVFGTMTKLYGIVGLAFFLFSKHKMKLVGGLVFWAVIVFLLPMLYASPEYVVHSYKEWFDVLVYKNGLNQFSINQNISLLGMLHRITGASFSDLWIIVPGMILFALPYLRIRQYQYESFRFLFLSSALFVYGTVQYRNGNLWLSDCYGCCWSLVCKDTDKSCHTDIESVIAYILYSTDFFVYYRSFSKIYKSGICETLCSEGSALYLDMAENSVGTTDSGLCASI